ncbi:MAG: hypothetical protein HUJ98_08375 [Bacteroidaceae bacterium]|nr:hypothetical protein [Bacteroidaceae bacterium]
MINNGAHETVGGMPTVASKIDLCGIARACGYEIVDSVDDYKALDMALEAAGKAQTLTFIEAKCGLGARDDLGRPISTPLENKMSFMDRLTDLK